MAVRDINEFKGYGGSTVHGIVISAGRTAIHGLAKGRITAVDHLINILGTWNGQRRIDYTKLLYINNGEKTLRCRTRIVEEETGEVVENTKAVTIRSYEDKFGDADTEIVTSTEDSWDTEEREATPSDVVLERGEAEKEAVEEMLLGWQYIDGSWYFFNPAAAEVTWNYEEESGGWRYNGSAARPYGSMYENETTPDGYAVGEDGAWIQ